MTGIPRANPDVTPEVIILVKVMLIIASSLGCFGNVCTLLTVATNKKLQTVPNAFLVNLAVTDLIVCAVIIPCNLLSFDAHFGLNACMTIGYISVLCLVLSVFTLGMVAMNRYIIICKSKDLYMKMYTKRNVAFMIASCWVVGLLFFSPPFYGFGKFGYNIKFGGCIFDAPDHLTYWFVFVMADSVAMFPTIILTLFCYLSILQKFRESRRKVDAGPATTTKTRITEATAETSERSTEVATNKNSSVTNDFQAKKKKESRKKEMAVIKNLVVIWATFMFNWFPLIVAYKVDFHDIVPSEVTHIFFAMAQSNSALNFIIYCAFNKQFRDGYIRTLTFGKKGNSC